MIEQQVSNILSAIQSWKLGGLSQKISERYETESKEHTCPIHENFSSL